MKNNKTSPVEFYSARFSWMPNGRAVCPFHNPTTPSLRVNLKTGSFRCSKCGARGRNISDFLEFEKNPGASTLGSAVL